ncbi:MAG: SDR family oxidoreductase [Cupriavidus necator]
MKIKDRVVVVTGGASGIGLALCERFAQEGARGVVVSDINGDGARAVAERIGGLAVQTNVGVESDVQALVTKAAERFGQVDVFCSNAGILLREEDSSNADWQRVMDVNLMAHVYAARAVLPGMLERSEGCLVNTASAAGLLTQMDSATYAVSKHAAVSYAEWLAVTYGDRGIHVSCLCPQGVRTPMLLGADGSRRAMLTEGSVSPEAVAEEVLKCIDEKRFLVLPHPEVLEYFRRKGNDYDRWLSGMRRLRAQVDEKFGLGR